MPLYYRVSPAIWNEPWDDDTRTLAFYILTSPHRTTEGLFKLPIPYVQADMGWPPRKIEKNMAKLEEAGFVSRHGDIILIRNALKYQPLQNENQVKSVLTGLETVPPSPLDDEFARLAERFSKRLAERLGERLPERFGNALALDSSSSSSSPPSPTDDVEEQLLEEQMRGHFWNRFLESDIDAAVERLTLRNRFGERIKDPAAWLTKVLESMACVHTADPGDSKRIELPDGTPMEYANGNWQEVSS